VHCTTEMAELMNGEDMVAVSTDRRERRAAGAGTQAITRPRSIPFTRNRQAALRLVPEAAPAAAPARRPAALRRNQVIADAGTIALGFVATSATSATLRESIQGANLGIAAFCTMAAWLLAMSANKLYVARAIERPSEEMRRILGAGAAGASSLVLVTFFARYDLPSRSAIAVLFGVVSLLLLIERRIARRVFTKLRASGRINRRIAVIGTDAHALALAESVQKNPSLGYQIVGFIGDDQSIRRSGRRFLGSPDRASDILREHECVGALISLNSVNSVDVNRLTRDLTDHSFHVALSTGLRDIDVTRMRPQGLDGQTLIYVEPTIRNGWRSSAKRAFDVVVALTGLILTAPFVAGAAIAIKLESDGPVFFKQDRVGRDGKTFQMVKLRSMYKDAEERKAALLAENESDGPLFKMRNDPRITKFGRVLRKLSIDEFPQFWNVVRGDMSIVGPRPALRTEVDQWDAELHDRLRVLPGITGMWQVSGRSDAGFDAYKRLDLYYVDNWSLLHDIRIVMKTFSVVLLQRGAS
jgi:exopolysaccharide biosynthesis polyprenyl glycosylphosphotransferase